VEDGQDVSNEDTHWSLLQTGQQIRKENVANDSGQTKVTEYDLRSRQVPVQSNAVPQLSLSRFCAVGVVGPDLWDVPAFPPTKIAKEGINEE
jgi:hypothetical protein